MKTITRHMTELPEFRSGILTTIEPRGEYVVERIPEKEDAIKVLKFLDTMNGIAWTEDLRRIETELREALFAMWRLTAKGQESHDGDN